jgi:uncharacterized lipoprotein YddW (UPF0748 family)
MNRKHIVLVTAILAVPPLIAADVPSPPREFRGVWVATVANIDWPSKKGLQVTEQKKELRAIFDKSVELKLNAVIFQVRPMADALYASKIEPWSEYLTGEIGKAPDPPWDPLEFAVREAHSRGLELHAWFNPYRARHPSATSPAPPDHIINRRPDLARPYGKHFWMNPTHKDVQDYSLRVILDVVRRYDIDGVHIDDYFYPYKETDADKKPIPFPDDDTWAKYQSEGGKLSRDDWRRTAVNSFVERMYKEVKAEKPWVKVGISPFGIWRPGHPPGIAGLDQFAELYADAKLWFNQGWCDYYSPQLYYWPIKQEKQSYPKLLAWWAGENAKGRHLWPGNIPARVTGQEKGWPAREISDQIEATRKQSGSTGNVHFSMKPLMQNTGRVADALKSVYTEPALVPASPWLGEQRPPTPKWTRTTAGFTISTTDKAVRLYVVRSKVQGKWAIRIVPPAGTDTAIPVPVWPETLAISAVDRLGNESEVVK